MQPATTLQFRKAVRKYAAKKGLAIYESWTNSGSDCIGRTVGFSMDCTPVDAMKIEKKLNKKGLTAGTRHTNSDTEHYFGNDYIRGTCIIA